MRRVHDGAASCSMSMCSKGALAHKLMLCVNQPRAAFIALGVFLEGKGSYCTTNTGFPYCVRLFGNIVLHCIWGCADTEQAQTSEAVVAVKVV
jgi:hypothetical protein